MTFEAIRQQFPILEQYTYFNTARYCATPKAVALIQERYLHSLSHHGSWNFEEWSDKYEKTRQMAAEMMSAKSDHIFFIPNVSTGINLSSLYLPKGRQVVLLNKDFPSVVLPWQSHGYEVAWCDYKAPDFYASLEDTLKTGGKIICTSWVQSADGFEIDLDRLFSWCKQYDATLVLDGTQGFGAIPFEVDPEVSMVFFTSCFKWLLSGYGVAIGYVSDDLLSRFKAFQGWNSIDFGTGHAKTGAASLEVGNAMFLNVLALYEGLSMIMGLGVAEICARNEAYRNDLIHQLESAGHQVRLAPGTRSTIFSVAVPEGKYEQLVHAQVQTSKQKGAVRLSPHFYNHQEDMDRLLTHLSA